MTDRTDPTPAALYARVSSDRQDVDLSVAAQLRALREHAERNNYLVVREYVDEAESARPSPRTSSASAFLIPSLIRLCLQTQNRISELERGAP